VTTASLLAQPVEPDPEQARRWLREELLQPEYTDTGLVERVLTWLAEVLASGLDAAARASGAATAAAVVVVLALVLAVLWLLSRGRSAGRRPGPPGPALTDERVGAEERRALAAAALSEERYGDAVVEGFRAVTARAIAAGWLEERPGLTAHEVARSLAALDPEREVTLTEAGRLFDAVRYGGRTATRAAALLVLDLVVEPARVATGP
jgi:hypothetical protein